MSTHVCNCKTTFIKILINAAQINSIRQFLKKNLNTYHCKIIKYNYLFNKNIRTKKLKYDLCPQKSTLYY